MKKAQRRSGSSPTPHDRRPAGKQLGIRVPADMGDQLKALARRENNGLSSVVRRLLTAALATSRGDEAA